ncbi:MAG TPA: winged helix DNA-binding domain-containing protein [Longimicrobiales bacterium]|nr:winged helix DNA-binding domain-containing protein [Longimicrobiales bacterium]
MDIARQRLISQRLIGEAFQAPADAVRWLGAVQSQDYPGAKWGVALRTQDATDAKLDNAFNAGEIIRTHALRPTWHFIARDDLRWILALTSARVHMMNGGQYRRMELDDVVLKRTRTVITTALSGGRYLTRAELGAELQKKRIVTDGQRLAYIAMHAELEGLICSGPVRGKQHTYALVDERVQPTPALARDEALAKLARRYFTSHGPATAHDFAWWSGLTVTDARRAAQMLDDELACASFEGKTYWFAPELPDLKVKRPIIHMLPNYDEHVVAYRDHGPSLDPRTPRALDGWGNALTAHLVVVNGLVVGGWRRSVERTQAVIQLTVPLSLKATERSAIKRETNRYGKFLGLPVLLNH